MENLGAVGGRVEESWEGINRWRDGEKKDDFRANRSDGRRSPSGGAMVGAKAICISLNVCGDWRVELVMS